MKILFMVMCYLMCGIACMAACIRLGFAPTLVADSSEHSAFSLACLLAWPLIVLIGAVMAVIWICRHVFGRFSMGLVKLIDREGTT
jgi:hypothetical protein